MATHSREPRSGELTPEHEEAGSSQEAQKNEHADAVACESAEESSDWSLKLGSPYQHTYTQNYTPFPLTTGSHPLNYTPITWVPDLSSAGGYGVPTKWYPQAVSFQQPGYMTVKVNSVQFDDSGLVRKDSASRNADKPERAGDPDTVEAGLPSECHGKTAGADCLGSNSPVSSETFLAAVNRALEDGEVDFSLVKIFILGIFGSGKTSFIRAIRGLPFCPNLGSTRGVEVSTTIARLSAEDVSSASNQPLLSTSNIDALGLLQISAAASTKQHLQDSSDATNQQVPANASHQQPETGDNVNVQLDAQQSLPPAQAWISELQQAIPTLSAGDLTDLREMVTMDDVQSRTLVEMLDCGGQLSFSTEQSIWLESRNRIFVVTTDCTKQLNEKVKESLFRDVDDPEKVTAIKQQCYNYTYLEYIQLWVSTISLFAQPHEGTPLPMKSKSASDHQPLVILTVTHLDCIPPDERPRMKENLRRTLFHEVISPAQRQGTVRFEGPFFVDNRALDAQPIADSEMNKIQKVILDEVLKLSEPERIPLRWLNFERVLKHLCLLQDFTGALSVQQVRALLSSSIISSSSQPPSDNDVHALLVYLDQRGVVKFPAKSAAHLDCEAIVFVDLPWLLSKMTAVTSCSLEQTTDYPLHLQDSIDLLESEGKLTDKLLDYLWSDISDRPLVKQGVLCVMQQMGLAFRSNLPPALGSCSSPYIVPSCISADQLGIDEVDDDYHSMPKFQLLLEEGLFPVALFQRAVVLFLEHLSSDIINLTSTKLRVLPEDGSLPVKSLLSAMLFDVQHIPKGIQLCVHCRCRQKHRCCSESAVALHLFVEELLAKLADMSRIGRLRWHCAFQCRKNTSHSIVYQGSARRGSPLTPEQIEAEESRNYVCTSCRPKSVQGLPGNWLHWMPFTATSSAVHAAGSRCNSAQDAEPNSGAKQEQTSNCVSDVSSTIAKRRLNAAVIGVARHITNRLDCIELGVILGVSDSALERLKGLHDFQFTCGEAFNMLNAWLQTNPNDGHALYDALVSINRTDLAERVKPLLLEEDKVLYTGLE